MAGELTAFGALPVPYTPLRKYLIDCRHATTDLTLERGPDGDLQTLARLLRDHHKAVLVTEGEEDPCDCLPTERQVWLVEGHADEEPPL